MKCAPPRGEPGTYVLVMRCATEGSVPVGRLGEVTLVPGDYLYVGSAFGPGGVRARVARHRRLDKPQHWHLDYLRPHLEPVQLWWSHERRRLEHVWAEVLARTPGLAGIPRFGASDCRCPSHLFRGVALPEPSSLSGLEGRIELPSGPTRPSATIRPRPRSGARPPPA